MTGKTLTGKRALDKKLSIEMRYGRFPKPRKEGQEIEAIEWYNSDTGELLSRTFRCWGTGGVQVD
jgi:hypothetical protein